MGWRSLRRRKEGEFEEKFVERKRERRLEEERVLERERKGEAKKRGRGLAKYRDVCNGEEENG